MCHLSQPPRGSPPMVFAASAATNQGGTTCFLASCMFRVRGHRLSCGPDVFRFLFFLSFSFFKLPLAFQSSEPSSPPSVTAAPEPSAASGGSGTANMLSPLGSSLLQQVLEEWGGGELVAVPEADGFCRKSAKNAGPEPPWRCCPHRQSAEFRNERLCESSSCCV